MPGESRRTKFPSRGVIAALLVTTTGLAGTGLALAQAEPSTAPPTGEPANLTDAKNAVQHYHDSGVWEQDTGEVDSSARQYLATRLQQGVEKPAIVLDIDDTSLSTYAFEEANDFGYDSAEFRQYALDRKLTGIDDTRDLVRFADAHGVSVFFVTGRREDPKLRQATTANLTEQGYPQPDGLFLRPVDDENPSAVPYKSGTRAGLEREGYRVLASVGDQHSDLDGGHAERTYKLPNPMYRVP